MNWSCARQKRYLMRQLLSHRLAVSATIGQWDTKSLVVEMTYLGQCVLQESFICL